MPEPRRLYRQIADQLRALIRSGQYALGARLPPERDLAVLLKVSRPTVREALIALEVEGLVEVRMGSGIYVVDCDDAAAQPLAIDAAVGPFDSIRARQLIEREIAATVARSPRRGSVVAALREALAEMEHELARGVLPVCGDRRFHLCLAEGADNAALLRVLAELYDARDTPLFERLGQHYEDAATWRLAIAEHRAVIDAIADGDARAARAAMHVHLELTHERLATLEAERGSSGSARPRLESLAA